MEKEERKKRERKGKEKRRERNISMYLSDGVPVFQLCPDINFFLGKWLRDSRLVVLLLLLWINFGLLQHTI